MAERWGSNTFTCKDTCFSWLVASDKSVCQRKFIRATVISADTAEACGVNWCAEYVPGKEAGTVGKLSTHLTSVELTSDCAVCTIHHWSSFIASCSVFTESAETLNTYHLVSSCVLNQRMLLFISMMNIKNVSPHFPLLLFRFPFLQSSICLPALLPARSQSTVMLEIRHHRQHVCSTSFLLVSHRAPFPPRYWVRELRVLFLQWDRSGVHHSWQGGGFQARHKPHVWFSLAE